MSWWPSPAVGGGAGGTEAPSASQREPHPLPHSSSPLPPLKTETPHPGEEDKVRKFTVYIISIKTTNSLK